MLDVRMYLAGAGVVLLGATALAQEIPATQPGSVKVTQEIRTQYWFGVAVEKLPPAIGRQLKLMPEQGLMVTMVLPDSPAEKAGLKAEDLLIDLDGNPLTTQEELARAANSNRSYQVTNSTTLQSSAVKSSEITYLRAGDKKSITIMPAPRPENMLVYGSNRDNFTLQPMGYMKPRAETSGVQNLVLPGGSAVQVGPGYQLEMSGDAATTVTMKSLKELVGNGEAVTLTQVADSRGKVISTITVGEKKYTVEAGKVDALPANIQPLAQQMLSSISVRSAGDAQAGSITFGVPGAVAGPAMDKDSINQRLNDLEKQNQELQKQLQELIRLQLQQQKEPAAK